mmetsp:Transcript_20186/g.47057  ORF Transcript_20186/g.47057 Transcript_20186/m.47057 type:complete len:147 (-) Transcript_20186:600-1040(-)
MWPGSPRWSPTAKPPAPKAARQTPLTNLPLTTLSSATSSLAGNITPPPNAAAATHNQNAGTLTGSRGGTPAPPTDDCGTPELAKAAMPDVKRAAKAMENSQLPPRKASSEATSIPPPGRCIVGSITCTGHRQTGNHLFTKPTLGIK